MNALPRKFLRRTSSPHYYHGRSVTKLSLQNSLQLISYFKTPKPNQKALTGTRVLKNSKRGKKALVLGSGPSLNNLNTTTVDSIVNDIFVINAFSQLKIASSVKPTLYGLSDPAHFGKLAGEQACELDDILDYVREARATLVLPHTAYEADLFLGLNKIYFDDRERTFMNSNLSPLKPRSYGSTTIYKMLAMAVFMGYEEIYILGFDNSNFLNYRGRPDNLLQDLGGATASRNVDKKSAFIGEYEKEFTSGMAGRMQSYAHLFGDLHKFNSHKIINLDPYSLTDAFPKVLHHPLIIE